MKKILSKIALALVLTTSLTALVSCKTPSDKQGDDSSSDSSYNVVTSAPDTTTAPVSDTTSAEDTTTSAPETTTVPVVETTTTDPSTIKWTDTDKSVYISVSNAWVRTAPNLDDTSRLAVLKLGDKLTCTATSTDWVKVTYADATCYISASCVTFDDLSLNNMEEASDKVYVTVDVVSLRLGPSTSTEILGYAKKGEELNRTGKSTDWSRVTVVIDNVSVTCYVSNSCLSTTAP